MWIREINMGYLIIPTNNKMSTKLYNYGGDKLPMKVLRNLHEVIDFVKGLVLA